MDAAMAENALRCAIESMCEIKTEFAYNPTTNLFEKEMPEWAVDCRNTLHACIDHLINAIDPKCEREYGWWNQYDRYLSQQKPD